MNQQGENPLEVIVLSEQDKARFGRLLKDHHYLGDTPGLFVLRVHLERTRLRAWSG